MSAPPCPDHKRLFQVEPLPPWSAHTSENAPHPVLPEFYCRMSSWTEIWEQQFVVFGTHWSERWISCGGKPWETDYSTPLSFVCWQLSQISNISNTPWNVIFLQPYRYRQHQTLSHNSAKHQRQVCYNCWWQTVTNSAIISHSFLFLLQEAYIALIKKATCLSVCLKLCLFSLTPFFWQIFITKWI